MKTNINYALVEETRPPLYTCMKYWGKKPHNIWRNYIETYTPKKGIYMDPFAGSAMCAFEAFFSKRKCCAFDINPLTSFVIETITSNYNEDEFITEVNSIVDSVLNDRTFKKLYLYRDEGMVHNVKWDNGKIYEVCIDNSKKKERKCLTPTNLDLEASNTEIDFTGLEYPTNKFRDAESFTMTFLNDIGDSYEKLYTKRNLYVLALIFNQIRKIKKESLQSQLLYGFIQTVHLSTKMCVPRGKSAKRDFSTSWGRSAFISSKKQMEMNPLLLFKNNCIGKQSVQSALRFFNENKHKKPVIADINKVEFDSNRKVDIWYGIIDSKNLTQYIPEKSISFILTDPPYGGLVQYLDLSSVWLSWLWLIDKKYIPNYLEEVTIGKGKDTTNYSDDLCVVLANAKKILADDGVIVITFNNKNIKVWDALLKSIANAGFVIEKVIHQPNKRSGESNVDDPNGVSASDYYIRCKKSNQNKVIVTNNNEIDNILLETVVELINNRNEPTPYQVLFNGFICKISQLGLDLSSSESFLIDFLKKHNGKELVMIKNDINRAGDYWWIADKKVDSKRTLTSKVEKFILKVINEIDSIKYEELLGRIYKKFPNGLTPDYDTIQEMIKKLTIENNGILTRRVE